MKIENKDDKPNTGRLHVDYANARNDQHEWECEQRALAREMRHQQQIHEERLRVPSPPPVSPFTIFDGNALLEVVKSEKSLFCLFLFFFLLSKPSIHNLLLILFICLSLQFFFFLWVGWVNMHFRPRHFLIWYNKGFY